MLHMYKSLHTWKMRFYVLFNNSQEKERERALLLAAECVFATVGNIEKPVFVFVLRIDGSH